MPIVLVGQICLDDGWYGDRHRVILFAKEGKGFNNKTEAKKYKAKLKKYIKDKFSNIHEAPLKVYDDNIICDELDKFPEYTYLSFGPSIYYKHHRITVDELNGDK